MADLEFIVNRVSKIQNGAKSLTWGVCIEREDKYAMFAVGHNHYRGEVLYIRVMQLEHTWGVETYYGGSYAPSSSVQVVDEMEVLAEVKKILARAFPAKNLGG